MLQKFFKYHGAGNDFILVDNRSGRLGLSGEQVKHICDRHTGFGADGLMLLEKSETKDFRMVYFNPDGSGGMMCGNGARCIISFAADLGVVSGNFPVEFEAPDGSHTAVILGKSKDPESKNPLRTIRLKMNDVPGVTVYPQENACFLDTGTRHLVRFVSALENYPVKEEGRALRMDDRFAPGGTNVDFVEPVAGQAAAKGMLRIRTFERGVEGETLACGTGIVASAIAACFMGIERKALPDGRVSYDIKAAISTLGVDFIPEGTGASFRARDVWLTGPVAFVGTMECLL